ncbi:MAG TPA: hypothetical protein VFG30_28365 [Polyangiales bacterium]|nr:hypothetical protein [Polyangiales bacterium]
MPSYSFTTLFNGTERPNEYGTVTIDYELVHLHTRFEFARPVMASGIIYPQATTQGRKSAPEPASGFQIGLIQKVPKKATEISPRNIGRKDMDKGHIFALELGGPDVKENICPQFSQLQQNGEWRKMERDAEAIAVDAGMRRAFVRMTIGIVYGKGRTVSRALTPAGFVVNLYEEAGGTHNLLRTYSIYNAQDATDDKMSYGWAGDVPSLSEGKAKSMGKGKGKGKAKEKKNYKKQQVVYGPSSSASAFDRVALGVELGERSTSYQAALGDLTAKTPGILLMSGYANDPSDDALDSDYIPSDDHDASSDDDNLSDLENDWSDNDDDEAMDTTE